MSSSPTTSYWCHRCSRLGHNITCLYCHGGFVEEVVTVPSPPPQSGSLHRRFPPSTMYLFGSTAQDPNPTRRSRRNPGNRSPFNPVIVFHFFAKKIPWLGHLPLQSVRWRLTEWLYLKCNGLEALLPPEVEKNDMPSESWKINLGKFHPLTETRDAEHGFFGRLRNLSVGKRCKVNDYLKKQKRLLEGYTEVETMIETGCASGNPAEDEMKQCERMAILVTNIANIVLFALKVFASIESKSLSIIASILDPFFDLLWGFILWLTSHAMKNPNPHKYPIGKKRMQPVGMIVFGSFGLQLLFLAAKQFVTKSEPEKDPQKQKWMIGVMTFVTMVEFMLAFYCRRFENKIVRAYAEHHSSNVKTNLISLAAAVLAIRYYWWIDPTGAIIILLYTMNSWKKTFFENLFALIGRTAPPEILAKLTYLILKHHEDIKQIDGVRAYTSGPDQYFVEVDIVLPQDMVLSKTRDIVGTLQVKMEQLPEVTRAFVHIDSEYTHRAEHRAMV